MNGEQGRARTYFEHGAERLESLASANGFGDARPLVEMFRELTEPWGGLALGALRAAPDGFCSDVADDHTPYEFSVVHGAKSPEIRLLVEAQGKSRGLQGNWEAGRSLSRRLAERHGASLARLHKLESLFQPRGEARFAIWHAVSFWPSRPPEFKVYLDAQARGRWQAMPLLEQALTQIGFGQAWASILDAGARGFERDELKYLSIDLSEAPSARVKVYWRHHGATAQELSALVSGFGLSAAEVEDFCRIVTGFDGPYQERAPFTCSALRSPEAGKGVSRTLYLPIAAYAPNDRAATDRIAAALERHGHDASTYRSSVEKTASRALERTNGFHSYVSLQKKESRRQVTVYISPEAHQIAPARIEAGDSDLGGEAIVRRYENDVSVLAHPYFQRLRAEPVSLSRLWLLMAGFHIGVVRGFPKRLATLTATVSDYRVRSILAHQLNDEMGHGDPTQAHTLVYAEMMQHLEPHRPAGFTEAMLEPARRLDAAMEELYCSSDPFVGIGASLVAEINGKKIDGFLGEEFRRQSELSKEQLRWVYMHEALEVDHAEESLTMSSFIPRDPAALQSAWRGADGLAFAAWRFFSELYPVTFS